jgi:hypothetical protein
VHYFERISDLDVLVGEFKVTRKGGDNLLAIQNVIVMHAEVRRIS